MAAGATNWVWANSRAANGSLLVLLVIAHECGNDGVVELRVMDLARKARLSDRAVRGAVKDLERLGELSVTPHRGGISRYALRQTPADIAGLPRQILPDPPADIAAPAESAPRQILPDPLEKPQVNGTPAESAGPQTSDESSSTGISVVIKPSSELSSGRPDVDRLCARLADRIVANGSSRPNITKRWKDAARRMIDIDGRTEEQVMRAIDWCQKDEFWSANILSMPKLREKYDQLRMKATQEQRRRSQPGRTGPDDDYAAALERIQARKETPNGTRGNSDNCPPGQVSIPSAAD